MAKQTPPGFDPLSDRQQQVLDFLTSTVNERGYPPSVREICDAVGLSSPSTVHSHLSSLVKAGYIRRDPSKPRAIEILTETESETAPAAPYADDRLREVPLVGRIAAGSPILAAEDIETVMPLPEELVGSDPVFMLEVRGDSMIDAGILDGDYVVVRRQPDARDDVPTESEDLGVRHGVGESGACTGRATSARSQTSRIQASRSSHGARLAREPRRGAGGCAPAASRVPPPACASAHARPRIGNKHRDALTRRLDHAGDIVFQPPPANRRDRGAGS